MFMEFIDLDKNSPTFAEDFKKEYAKIVSKIKQAEIVLSKKLKAVLSGAPAKATIDIKDPDVALEKFARKDKKYKKITDMPDLLRARIVSPINMPLEHFKRRVEKVIDRMPSEFIDNPDSGYSGVWHMDANIDGLRVEIQIVPRGFPPYADLSHKVVYEPKRQQLPVDPREEQLIRMLLQNRVPAISNALHDRLRKYKNNRKTRSIDDLDAIANDFYLLSKYASLSSVSDGNFKFVVLQKPLAAGKAKEIEDFIKQCGAKILNRKKVLIDSRVMGHHYQQFADKSFFIPLLKYYVGKDIYVWLVEGTEEAQKKMRSEVGGPKVDPGSFRHVLVGDSYKEVMKHTGVLDNGIHVSDSPSEGLREAKLWFGVPELSLSYSPTVNDEVIMVHTLLWKRLNSIPWASVQYSNTNNETAVISKPVDIDYRVLVPANRIDETVDYIVEKIPGAFLDREGFDERTGSKYKKLEFVFKSGKADIAVVNRDDYKDRIGSGHLVDILSKDVKVDIGRRKEEAWNKGKEEYKKTKEQIQKEIKERFKI